MSLFSSVKKRFFLASAMSFSLFYETSVWAEPTSDGQSANPSIFNSFLIPMLLILGVFYLLVLRPQQRQQRERAKMIENLKIGDEVITTAGIHARIHQIIDRVLVLDLEQGKMKISREGIAALKLQEQQTDKAQERKKGNS